jgi:hypothetical protein
MPFGHQCGSRMPNQVSSCRPRFGLGSAEFLVEESDFAPNRPFAVSNPKDRLSFFSNEGDPACAAVLKRQLAGAEIPRPV